MAAAGSVVEATSGSMSRSEASSSGSIDAAAAVPDLQTSSYERIMSSPAWHVEAVRGRRPKMEDAYCHGTVTICVQGSGQPQQQQVMVGGCFDGHGGDSVAKYLARNIPERICSRLSGSVLSSGSVAAALSAAFTDLDQELHAKRAASLKGSTALVALVTSSTVHISSCGDSRAIVISNAAAFQPVEDHTPTREDEQARVRAAGGQVFYHNGCRVMGALAMTRAIGDHVLRPYGVIADPDVAHYTRQAEDEFLLLASDGLWAVLSNQDVADLVSHAVAELTAAGMSRLQVTAVLPKLLTKVALARGSSDNVTVLVMDLQASSSSSSSSDSPKCSSSGELAAVELPAAGSDDDSCASTERCVQAAAASVAEVHIDVSHSTAEAGAVLNEAAYERMKMIIRTAAADAHAKAAAEAAAAALPSVPAAAAADDVQRRKLSGSSDIASASPFAVASAACAARVAAAAAAAAGTAAAASKLELLQHSRSAPALLVQQQQQPPPAEAATVAEPAPVARDRTMSWRSRSVLTSLSPFAVAAAERSGNMAGDAAEAALQPLCCALDNTLASRFVSMQRASVAQVWRDCSSVHQGVSSTIRTSSGSTASGICGLLSPGAAAAAAAAADAGTAGQKRRMVTTESPGLAAGLSAPAKLQRGQDVFGSAVCVTEAQKRWVAAAQRVSQLAMQVNA